MSRAAWTARPDLLQEGAATCPKGVWIPETSRLASQRRPLSRLLVVLLSLGLALASCRPAPSLDPLDDETVRLDETLAGGFSVAHARGHVERLARLGPRLPDSRAERRARRYVEQELREAGLVPIEIETPAGRHLLAELPGAGADGLLLVAPWAMLGPSGAIDDGGIAVLLELGRVFARTDEPLPYGLRLAFCEVRAAAEGRGGLEPGGGARAGADREGPSPAGEDRSRVVAAGRSLAGVLAERGELGRLRGVVVLDGISRPGLRLARDLRSYPVYREIFWERAAALGFETIFPTAGGWASPVGIDLGFRELGMDRVVTLMDEIVARPELEPPRAGAGAVSERSLEAVGRVSLEAIREIMRRLARIDAFGP
jgi:hypothetical protein